MQCNAVTIKAMENTVCRAHHQWKSDQNKHVNSMHVTLHEASEISKMISNEESMHNIHD